MNRETYTPGHTTNAVEFMSQRTWESHGQFFASYLKPGDRVLDCGCGPGTITVGIATAIAPGSVTGIDFGESQIQRARVSAADRQFQNVDFQAASCYAIPFEDGAFDAVFCHALMEHLAEPVAALRELFRVLKSGGYVGVCSPDFGGLILAPASDELEFAISAYAAMQQSNGGDLYIGHKFGKYLSEAGFHDVMMNARYECYPSMRLIGEYLATQLDQNHQGQHAQTLREWSRCPDGLFAQAWVSAIGRK